MIDIERSVLLVMDYQNEVIENHCSDPDLLKRAARVIGGARKAGLPVVYVVVAFREGHPEIGRKSSFRVVKEAGRLVQGTHEAAIHPAVAPLPGEVVVTKKRVGAFSGSDLDLVLRNMQRDTLILMGVATSGVVLSTIRLAADLDYSLVVISDCCSDRDPEVHGFLMEKVFHQATIMPAEMFLSTIASSTQPT